MLSLEGEEEHNWVFSADQLGDEVAGMIKWKSLKFRPFGIYFYVFIVVSFLSICPWPMGILGICDQ